MKQGLLIALLLISFVFFAIQPSSGSESTKFTTGTPVILTASDTWPMFGHDPRNTRFSSGSAPHSPNLLWQYEGDFWSHSSPVVSDGRVFMGSDIANTAYCLNATDGFLLWRFETNETFSNSPVVFDGRLFLGGQGGDLYCLNASAGALIWKTTLNERIGGSSPAVANGKIFVGGVNGHVYCFNMTNGEQMWNCSVGAYVNSSPAIADGRVFVSNHCINELTGQILWSYPTGGSVGSSSPAVTDGHVFFGCTDKNLYCVNENDGSLVWNRTLSSWTESSPAIANGIVFIPSEDGFIYALNATTGAQIWTHKSINQVTSSPSIADGMVFISSAHLYGGLMALNAADGNLIWNYSGIIQGTSVAIAEGRIFASFKGSIRCIGSPYSLTITSTFNDNNGNALGQAPSEWSIMFPNRTIFPVFSESVTYPQAQNGNYSIVSIVWQGNEVVPDKKPTIFVDSNSTWNPEINCKLPTQLVVDLSTSTSFIGFWVNISGKLVDYKNVPINGAQILMQYSVTGAEPWSVITADYTAADGSYSALWVPAATGNFVVRATYQGNETYPSSNSSINLAVKPFEATNVFSVVSNSSISELAFNTTDWKLSFRATGPNGTSGFVKVTVAKSLVADPANVKVYLDGNQTDFAISSTDDSWLLSFTYKHSTHTLVVDLDTTMVPELSFFVLSLFMIATLFAAMIYRRKSTLGAC